MAMKKKRNQKPKNKEVQKKKKLQKKSIFSLAKIEIQKEESPNFFHRDSENCQTFLKRRADFLLFFFQQRRKKKPFPQSSSSSVSSKNFSIFFTLLSKNTIFPREFLLHEKKKESNRLRRL
jgi:hypothetical protein